VEVRNGWSGDGRWILYVRVEIERDFMLVENLR
jgi:hypothetical protein